MVAEISILRSCSVGAVFSLSLGQHGGRHLAKFYKMADFQRPYVWTQGNIQKLLDDVDELRANPKPYSWREWKQLYGDGNSPDYFLGSICLRRVDPKKKNLDKYFEVLDGQQRLTSILILACVLDKQVSDYVKSEKEKRFVEAVVKCWGKIILNFGKTENWKEILAFTNPQSKKQIECVYWSLMRDYECLKKDVKEGGNTTKLFGMDVFEQTLYRDIQRLKYILEKGKVVVLILKSNAEAEQFFQGENNRGLPMSLLDLLKAYHMRQESRELRIKKISRIWWNLGLTIEKKENKRPAEEEDILKMNPAERWKEVDPDWTVWLMGELVFPALLMQYGIDPWSASEIENLALLKGMEGTHTGDYFVDKKLAHQLGKSQTEEYFDLRAPIRPGLPFFQELEQYLKLAQAIDVILCNPGKSSQQKIWPYLGAALVQSGLSLDDSRIRILKLAMIAWADRFLKAEVMRNDSTWVDVAEALVKDGEFRIYGRNFAHFLDRLKVRHKSKNAIQIGAYKTLKNETLCRIVQLSEPENNLLFLPHRSSSPRECLRKFKIATQPGVMRFSDLKFYQGYRNAYEKEELLNDNDETNKSV